MNLSSSARDKQYTNKGNIQDSLFGESLYNSFVQITSYVVDEQGADMGMKQGATLIYASFPPEY